MECAIHNFQKRKLKLFIKMAKNRIWLKIAAKPESRRNFGDCKKSRVVQMWCRL
jgi:hypothetical protein